MRTPILALILAALLVTLNACGVKAPPLPPETEIQPLPSPTVTPGADITGDHE